MEYLFDSDESLRGLGLSIWFYDLDDSATLSTGERSIRIA